MPTVKSPLKWVGGKTQLLDTILPVFPTQIQDYYELFLGGGSVLLALLSESPPLRIQGNIYAYDTNPVLISFYQHLQTQPQALFETLQEIIQDFQSIPPSPISNTQLANRNATTPEEAKTSRETYYYWIRKLYNLLTPEQQQRTYGVALFVFLNKTCFRGIFHVGPNGFNIPYGYYVNPEIADYQHWMEINHLIQPVNFIVMDCAISMVLPQPGDFVYLDPPPYAKETQTSLVGDSMEAFSRDKNTQLFQQCHQWTRQNISWAMSNFDVPLLQEYFPIAPELPGENPTTPPPKYQIQHLTCRRSIHSKKPDTIGKEILISYLAPFPSSTPSKYTHDPLLMT